MKTLRTLIRLDAVLLALFGLTTITYTRTQTLKILGSWHRFEQEQAPLVFLGTTVVVLAIVLYTVSGFALIGHRRRLGTLLAIGNLVIAVVVVAAQPSDWARFLGWIPALVLLIMAMALAWASRRPMGPDAAAAELAALQIPDDIREALRRQIGGAAAQEERNRLARDLHDSIKQQLFSINVGTAAVQERWERDPEGARSMLADVRRSAKEALVEMQALLHQLRPQALTSTGLVEALREQCEALGYRTGAEVILELGEPLPDGRLLPGTEETLFRIAQEALGNVARHARARRVRVWMGRDGGAARIWIRDDGQGFDPGPEASGMGLRNIKERAESLRGNLSVATEQGAGTTVDVWIPLTSPPGAFEDQGMSFLLAVAAAAWLIHPRNTGDSWEAAISGVVFTIVLINSAISTRRRVQSSLGIQLQHVIHRDCAMAFFLAAGLAPWPWRSGEIWSGWMITWLAVALVCMGLAVVELGRFHRASESRRQWWRISRFKLTAQGWIALVVFSYLLVFGSFILFSAPSSPLLRRLGTVEIIYILLGVALLLYVRSRRPPTEGDAP